MQCLARLVPSRYANGNHVAALCFGVSGSCHTMLFMNSKTASA
jgi:hypothetical protein